MKTCERPDCTELSRQWGYCPKHAALVRRRGVPYRRDETDEQQAGNAVEREMAEALEADPPVIEWEKRGAILVHVSIHDPHQDKPNNPRPIYIGDAP